MKDIFFIEFLVVFEGVIVVIKVWIVIVEGFRGKLIKNVGYI